MSSERLERVRPRPGAPVHVQVMGDARLDHVVARDISVDGLAMLVPDGFLGCSPESEIKVGISLPDRASFVCNAQVKHTTVYGGQRFVGVALLEISSQQRELLEGYVHERVREEDTARGLRYSDRSYPMEPPELD